MTHTVLAIESSCDDTCAAVVCGTTVLSNVVASQFADHQKYGGVVPEIASRRHLELIDTVIEAALDQAGLNAVQPAIDAIAVTQGPGLVGALLVGIAAAKARAFAWSIPLIPVDHLAGHVASALLAQPDLEPPFICLLVSGGHTLVLDVAPRWEMTVIGSTRDDSAGEAFDKGARLLGLAQPGGPAIEQAAARFAQSSNAASISFTPAMVNDPTLDTSFAGIKTALAVALRADASVSVEAAAAAFEGAIVETLRACVAKATQRYERSVPLVVVGGVAANGRLRSALEDLAAQQSRTFVTVERQYCGDNAAMIGVAAQWFPPVHGDEQLLLDAYPASALSRLGILAPMPVM